MHKLTIEDVNTLMEYDGEWGISLFMSTHRHGTETRQDPIRYKNLLRLAANAAAQRENINGSLDKAIEEAQRLLPDNDFWQHQSDGLAVFAGPGFFAHYQVPHHFAENVIVDNRFQVKQLLPVVQTDGRFYLLTLNRKHVHIYECNRGSIEELQVIGVPVSIEEYLAFIEVDVSGKPRPGRPRDATRQENDKKRLGEFFQRIDNGLHDLLKTESAPLVVACVDYLFPIFKDVCSYSHVAEEFIAGNPDAYGKTDLHQKAWQIAKPILAADWSRSLQKYAILEGSDRASCKLSEVIPAAAAGRVRTLLVNNDQERWGIYDRENGKVTETREGEPHAEELINLCTVLTLEFGGTVHALKAEDIPHGAPVAALLRY